MRCGDLTELISAYADGQTGPAQTEMVEAHLTGCARCQAILLRHRQTARLLRLADPIDDWQVPDLRLRIAHAAASNRRRHGMAPHRVAVGVVAVLAAFWAVAGPIASGPAAQVAQGTPPAMIGAPPCRPCAAPKNLALQMIHRSPRIAAWDSVPAAIPRQAGGTTVYRAEGGAGARPGGMRATPL